MDGWSNEREVSQQRNRKEVKQGENEMEEKVMSDSVLEDYTYTDQAIENISFSPHPHINTSNHFMNRPAKLSFISCLVLQFISSIFFFSMDHHHPWDDHDNQYNFNIRILFTAVTSLFLVIVLVVLLHIYARCVLRRQSRRRTNIRLSVGMQMQSREPPKTGLEPSVIASLPVLVYKRTEEQLDETNMMECTVCLSSIEDGEMARVLPNCKHMFHVECIDMWLNSHSTCPICRTSAEPQASPAQTHEASVGVPPMAPPLLDSLNSTTSRLEAAPDGAAQPSKAGGSFSRLSSFKRMLSIKDRSERRIQASGQADGVEDLERQ